MDLKRINGRLLRLGLLLWLLIGVVVLVAAIAGDGVSGAWARITNWITPEDVGARLRRECESIVREGQYADIAARDDDYRDKAVRRCVTERGHAGR